MLSLPSSSYGFISFPPRTARSSGETSTSSTSSFDSSVAITSIELGEFAELPCPNDIMKNMECPICKEIAYPPIFNCANGHPVCGTCRPKLANCALCKAVFTEGRNYPLESMVLSSKFHCHYKDRGCTAIIAGESYREHLRKCPSRPGAGTHQIQAQVGTGSPVKSAEYVVSTSSVSGDDDSNWTDTETESRSSSGLGEFEVVNWVKCKNGQYPSHDMNPVIAGYSAGRPVYVARAYQGSRLVMGRMIPAEKAAYVYWHGCQKKWYYEILVSIPHTVRWVDASWGDVPVNAISGGESPDMENVYIGRAIRNGQFVPGYVQPSCQGCYIGVGLQLYLCHDYQVLVVDV